MKKKSLLLTAVATLGLTAASMAQNVPSYVPTNGLVGWWPFNGNANDESGNGNNGTVSGATLTSDRFGNTNKAYSFDGIDDYITVPQNLSSFALSIWFRKSISNAQYSDIFHYENGYAQLVNDTTFYARVQYPSPPSIGSSTTVNLNTDEWHHMVFNFDSINQQFDIHIDNSIHLISGTGGGGVYYTSFNNNTFYFGGLQILGLYYFNGKIDDIGIWNRALTSQEITDLYNGNICYQTITVTDTLLINMGITGFNPITYNNTIKIFPNPTNDHITINYGNFASLNGYQLKIENSLGQQVFQTNINQQSDYLNLTNWGGNGLYFVRIIDPQGNTIDIRKIVLQ